VAEDEVYAGSSRVLLLADAWVEVPWPIPGSPASMALQSATAAQVVYIRVDVGGAS